VLVDWRDDQVTAIRDFLFAPYAVESANFIRLG
jgi:RNA polymerase sigma-70 factor (ECF subfamily)